MKHATVDQELRTARALREMTDYTLRPHDGSWIVEGPSGHGYLVTADSCTCGDWEHRCRKVGARCKHQVFAAHTLFAEGVILEGDAPEFPAGPRDVKPTRLAEIAADDEYLRESARISAILGRPYVWTREKAEALDRIL